jgi:hypothetical protein
MDLPAPAADNDASAAKANGNTDKEAEKEAEKEAKKEVRGAAAAEVALSSDRIESDRI